MPILRIIHRTSIFRILLLPVRVDCGCHPDQPGAVFGNFQKVRRGKVLGPVRRRVAQRLEHPGMNQCRTIVRLAV